jgi:hypothetical protein
MQTTKRYLRKINRSSFDSGYKPTGQMPSDASRLRRTLTLRFISALIIKHHGNLTMKTRDMYCLKKQCDNVRRNERTKLAYPFSRGNRPCCPLNTLPKIGSRFSSAAIASYSSLENCIRHQCGMNNSAGKAHINHLKIEVIRRILLRHSV